MTSGELSIDDLGVTHEAVYREMGYGDTLPDATTIAETDAVIGEAGRLLHARYCFFITDGELSQEQYTLDVMGRTLDIGKIIARSLRGSQRYLFFVATAGEEFEEYQKRLKIKGDMVRIFIADALGSVIAECAADRMETAAQRLLDSYGLQRTNRFSPGYCGWHVSQQHRLFSLFPDPAPCGVTLTDSSLMIPIKSVSGVIGVGEKVRRLDYSCSLCDFAQCFRRKNRKQDKS